MARPKHSIDITTICPVCNKAFSYTPYNRYRKYCSIDCCLKAQTNRVEKVCPVCHKAFSVPVSNADRYKVCSIKCRLAFTLYRRCLRCRKHFTAKRQNHLYCSEPCRRPPQLTTCENCGKSFRRRPSEVTHRFCSKSCYKAYVGGGGETSIEHTVRQFLETIYPNFKPQVQLGSHTVDFFIPALNLIIEADGEYWHRDGQRMKIQNQFFRRHGYNILRLSEKMIKSGVFKDRILEALTQL